MHDTLSRGDAARRLASDTDFIARLPGTVSHAHGAFAMSVHGRETGDESWEGWLEFVPIGVHGPARVLTGIETHQKDRLAMERWASGLTAVYAEGALSRALALVPQPEPDVLAALEAIAHAVDLELGRLERAHESTIAADARHLRDTARRRAAALRKTMAAGE